VRSIPTLALTLLLLGCGKPDNAPGPGGVTVGEAKALDQAAEMVEAKRLPAEAMSGAPAQAAPAQAAPVQTTPAQPKP
jgi:hypothetical protein